MERRKKIHFQRWYLNLRSNKGYVYGRSVWYNNARSELQALICLISTANNIGRFVTIGVYSFHWVVRTCILFGISCDRIVHIFLLLFLQYRGNTYTCILYLNFLYNPVIKLLERIRGISTPSCARNYGPPPRNNSAFELLFSLILLYYILTVYIYGWQHENS